MITVATSKTMDVAGDLVVPMMEHMVRIDRDAPRLCDVCSSFCLPSGRGNGMGCHRVIFG